MSRIFATLTLITNLSVITVIALRVASRHSDAAHRRIERIRDWISEWGLFAAWSIASVSTLGSLYYSEVARFTPCKLCWYQRIAMYPLSVILAIAAIRSDRNVRGYVLPLVSIGALLSTYHYALQRLPGLSGGSCDPAVPCTVTWVWEFHYISIPFMALSGFVTIAMLMLLIPRENSP